MSKYLDHFGTPLDIGDIALTAKPGGRYFDTQYAFVVVVGKTPKLLRVHQIPTGKPEISVDDFKDSLKRRMGRKGGKVDSRALISTGKKVNVTEAQINDWIDNGYHKDVTSPTVQPIFSTWYYSRSTQP